MSKVEKVREKVLSCGHDEKAIVKATKAYEAGLNDPDVPDVIATERFVESMKGDGWRHQDASYIFVEFVLPIFKPLEGR